MVNIDMFRWCCINIQQQFYKKDYNRCPRIIGMIEIIVALLKHLNSIVDVDIELSG
jgi:hypothetical protein